MVSDEGSSPLSRGILHIEQNGQRADRIIPALAGNTETSTARTLKPRDHPRSRGEYETGFFDSYIDHGSSPLSRGIPGGKRMLAKLHRIIPALAGNTGMAHRYDVHGQDHPRSRGEYYR